MQPLRVSSSKRLTQKPTLSLDLSHFCDCCSGGTGTSWTEGKTAPKHSREFGIDDANPYSGHLFFTSLRLSIIDCTRVKKPRKHKPQKPLLRFFWRFVGFPSAEKLVTIVRVKTEFCAIPRGTNGAQILFINEDFSKNELGRANPPENHLGLWRLASYLHSRGQTAQIVDTTGFAAATDLPERFGAWLSDRIDAYDAIGFYLTSWNLPFVLRSLAVIAPRIFQKPIFFGGPLVTAQPEALLRLVVDRFSLRTVAAVQGYGEFVLSDALSHLDSLKTVDGLWSMIDGELTRGRLLRFSEKELADLPLLEPQFNSFFAEVWEPILKSGKVEPWSLSEAFPTHGLDTNQGCVFSCSYCSLPAYGRSVASYSPARVADELERQAHEMGFWRFSFTNSNLLFLTREWMLGLLDEFEKRRFSEWISWNGYHHPMTANLLTRDDFVRIKAAGCDQLVLGVQSVEPTVARLFRRPENTEILVREIVEKMRGTGVSLVIDCITGVPSETDEAIDRFFDWCISEEIEVRDFQLKFYPATELPNILRSQKLPHHHIVPITGELAPELESFALISTKKNEFLAPRAEKLRQKNRDLLRNTPLRFGRTEIRTESEARAFLADLPNKISIPQKIRRGWEIQILAMLQPKIIDVTAAAESPKAAMRTVLLAAENAPPMLRAMQERLRKELGEERFLALRKQFLTSSTDC